MPQAGASLKSARQNRRPDGRAGQAGPDRTGEGGTPLPQVRPEDGRRAASWPTPPPSPPPITDDAGHCADEGTPIGRH